jgi:hypothetical protein
LLSPQDRALIADAVRDGMRPEPVPIRTTAMHFAIAILALFGAIGSYQLMSSWRPPTNASFVFSDLSTVRHMDAWGNGAMMTWKMSAQAHTLRIIVETGDQVELTLPGSDQRCEQIASALHGSGEAGVIRTNSVGLSWSAGSVFENGSWRRDDVYMHVGESSAISVRTDVSGLGATGPARQPYLPPSLAVQTNRVAMNISSGGRGRQLNISALEGYPTLESGPIRYASSRVLPITVRSASPAPFRLSIDNGFRGQFRLFQFQTDATVQDIDRFSGTLTTSATGRVVVSPPSVLHLTGQASDPLHVTCLLMSDGSSVLKLDPAPVHSVLADQGEIIPSAWSRYAAIVGPIWGGLLGVLVLAELATAIRGVWNRPHRKAPAEMKPSATNERE